MQSFEQLVSDIQKLRTSGQSIGYISGCFDLLHSGHLRLFEFAKKHVDVVVIALDNDESIRMSKGAHRPITHQEDRAYNLNALKNVDYVFLVEEVHKFSKVSGDIHKEYFAQLKPDALITHIEADSVWKFKKQVCEEAGMQFIGMDGEKLESTTAIIERIHALKD